MKSEGMPFTSAHVSSVAARAAELERLGEELQDAHALIRAARMYTLAVRIADELDGRDALPFMRSDLARVRDELRMLAIDAAAMGILRDRGIESVRTIDSNGAITRVFREIAVCIEQRLTHGCHSERSEESSSSESRCHSERSEESSSSRPRALYQEDEDPSLRSG
jgi:hypothetical protein